MAKKVHVAVLMHGGLIDDVIVFTDEDKALDCLRIHFDDPEIYEAYINNELDCDLKHSGSEIYTCEVNG